MGWPNELRRPTAGSSARRRPVPGIITLKLRRVALLGVFLALSGCATAPALSSSPGGDPTSVPRLLVRLDLAGVGWPGLPVQHVADYLTDGTVIRVHDGVLQ